VYDLVLLVVMRLSLHPVILPNQRLQ